MLNLTPAKTPCHPGNLLPGGPETAGGAGRARASAPPLRCFRSARTSAHGPRLCSALSVQGILRGRCPTLLQVIESGSLRGSLALAWSAALVPSQQVETGVSKPCVPAAAAGASVLGDAGGVRGRDVRSSPW